jgi:hypothetical protein
MEIMLVLSSHLSHPYFYNALALGPYTTHDIIRININ